MIPPGDSAVVSSVVSVLQTHRGRLNPITLANLAAQAGITRRAAEQILELYASDFPFLVVGSSTGMYIATEPSDLNHERASRYSRIRCIARGWSARKAKALALGWSMEGGRFVASPRQPDLF